MEHSGAPTFTPAQAPPLREHPRQIASLWRRALATLIDGCIVGFPALLVLLPGRLITGDFGIGDGFLHTPSAASTTGELLFSAVEYALMTAAAVLYVGLLTARSGRYNGQTVGKQALSIQIAMPGGEPVTAGAAWARAIWLGVALTLPVVLGLIVDTVAGTSPTLSDVGLIIGSLLSLAVVLAALAGDQRRMLHDRFAGTIVADVGEGEVRGRMRTTRTIALGATATALTLLTVGVLGVSPTWLDSNPARANEIMALEETKQAHGDLTEIEAVGKRCMKSSPATVCELRVTELLDDLDFIPPGEFDLEVDEIGTHAGSVSVLADDDDLYAYVFTGADRTWVSRIQAGGKVSKIDRNCLPQQGTFCEGIWLWPDWND